MSPQFFNLLLIEADTYDTINYFLRLAGRLGFVLLLITIYRVYLLFSSPLVKKRHKYFVRLFAFSVVFSFILLAANYVYPVDWLSAFSMAYNVATTFVLAIYLYRQGNILEHYQSSDEFRQLSQAMDSYILVLKHK